VKEKWYDEVMDKVTEEKWLEITNMLKEDTAPSISDIGYRLVKKVSKKTRKHFIEFTNRIVCEGKFPKK
jgi:hypothetical protein